MIGDHYDLQDLKERVASLERAQGNMLLTIAKQSESIHELAELVRKLAYNAQVVARAGF